MTVRQVLGRSSVRATQDFSEIEFPARFQAGLAENHRPYDVDSRRSSGPVPPQGNGGVGRAS